MFSLLRDKAKVNQDFIEMINNNEKEWIKEFKENQRQIMINSREFSIVLNGFSKYASLCKTYEENYELSKILFSILSQKRFIDNDDLFIHYYELLVCHYQVV